MRNLCVISGFVFVESRSFTHIIQTLLIDCSPMGTNIRAFKNDEAFCWIIAHPCFYFPLNRTLKPVRPCDLCRYISCLSARNRAVLVWKTNTEASVQLTHAVCVFSLRLTMMMMMKREMRIRPEGTGPIKWILFCPWLDMLLDWGTCGDSLTSPSETVEVRVHPDTKKSFKKQWNLI